MHKTHAACLGLAAALAFAGPALAQVEVFDDQTNFVNATGATQISIPNAATAFPAQADNNCGAPQAPSTDVSRGEFTNTAKIEINFGTANKLTLMQDLTAPATTAVGLCVFDGGHIRATGNTDPNVMIADTIVANGEDDYLMTFDNPVHAIGFRLLTNSSADEIVDLRDATPSLISSEDIDGLTAINTRQFVGFKSVIPIKSLLIDTTGGALQNEGIDEIKVAERFQVDIDIKPGSFPNSINLGSGGVTPVAILGSASLDVNDIDVTTLVLGTAGVKTVGKTLKTLCSVEDVSGDFTFPEGAPDGFDDLVCKFITVDLAPEAGDTTAKLTGNFLPAAGGGAIEGTDSVNIVP